MIVRMTSCNLFMENKVNQYGVPLHACNGYRYDEHYWVWLNWVITQELVGTDENFVYYKRKI